MSTDVQLYGLDEIRANSSSHVIRNPKIRIEADTNTTRHDNIERQEQERVFACFGTRSVTEVQRETHSLRA
jgi:hypothetical protein